ncbi:MAG: hypothetical protein R3325_06450, partial [Thermoanaerobaculia bacterium]|nr:hypothetical protein [Thermoanaerobaculia bacterium]
MRRAGPLGLLLALLAGPAPAAAPGTGAEEYDALQQWRFGPRRELPAEGFSFARDTASWRLLEGRIRLQEPTADGAVAGLLFEGRGRFVMEVPDPVELRQLRRFAADPELQRLEVELDTLIVRASSPDLLSALAGGGPYRPHPLVAKRHESWLRDGLTDVDSRIVGARRCAGDELLWVEMRTADHGWLTWVYDALRHEEIELWRWNRAFARRESWVSLDRPEDRSPGGRPGPRG